MIVNQQQDGWEVIYHRGHALLAAKLASHWQQQDRPERLIETIAAIFNHDDLEREWEGNHLGPSGAPLDFTLNDTIEVNKLRRLVEGAFYRGRWVALLTSMHIRFLFELMREQNAELAAFLDEQDMLEKQLRGELKINKAEAEQAYAFMQCCDRLSLILTRQELPERERALEISKGPDGTRYDIMQRNDGSITITPWPFVQSSFTVDVEATYLTQVSFESNEMLTDALKQGEIRTLEWLFRK